MLMTKKIFLNPIAAILELAAIATFKWKIRHYWVHLDKGFPPCCLLLTKKFRGGGVPIEAEIWDVLLDYNIVAKQNLSESKLQGIKISLWTCDLKIKRVHLFIRRNPCTKFGIDQAKGSKDIERITQWAEKNGLSWPLTIIQVYLLCRSKSCLKQVSKGLKYIKGTTHWAQKSGLTLSFEQVIWKSIGIIYSCTKFGIDQVKGSRDIEPKHQFYRPTDQPTEIYRPTDGCKHYAPFFKKGGGGA